MIEEWDLKVERLFRDFSNREKQFSQWSGNEQAISSPYEMCNWIDDLDLSGWVNQNTSLSASDKSTFFAFMDLIDDTPDFDSFQEAHVSKYWSEIRKAANAIVNEFFSDS